MEWQGGRYESQRQWCTVSYPAVSSVRAPLGLRCRSVPSGWGCWGWFLVQAGTILPREGFLRGGVVLRAATGSAPGGAPCGAPPGAERVVCARWCPTLPHPGGCSTIGAVRLSFRVRDGSGRFPVAVTTETTTWAVRQCSCDSVIRLPANTHTRTLVVCGWWLGWVWTV